MVGVTNHAALDPNGIFVSLLGAPVYGETVTIASGQNLAAGAVLGQTSGGKYVLALADSEDGSQTPDAILAEACDASGGDKQAFVYYQVECNQRKLVLGTGITLNAALRKALSRKGIFLHASLPA